MEKNCKFRIENEKDYTADFGECQPLPRRNKQNSNRRNLLYNMIVNLL